MKQAMIAHYEALLGEENFGQVRSQLEALELQIRELQKAEAEQQTGAETAETADSEGGTEAEGETPETPAAEAEAQPTPEKDTADEQFEQLKARFNALVNAERESKVQAQKNNLEGKKQVIEDIRELIGNEENISRAFNRFKELQETWTSLGSVSGGEYKEIQAQYSQVVEQFYYNINIYKALQEHDLKRNFERKSEVITKLQQLQSVDSIKDAEGQLRVLMEEWDQIGPTRREQWEEVRERYRTITAAIFDRIRKHYKGLKEQQKENLARKTALAEQAEAVLELEFKTVKDWQQATNSMLEFQQQWKTIGFATKKDNERIWQRFRTACDQFFARKKEYYSGLKEDQNKNRDRKRDLIGKAKALRDSDDWKKTTQDIINLQKQWKTIGPAQQRDEQKLWRQFREHCDHFFNAKKAFFGGMDDRQAANEKAQKELIEKVKGLKLTGEREADLEALGELGKEWEGIGPAPSKVRNKLREDFQEALNAHYDQMGLGEEKAHIQFQQKLERLKHAERHLDLLQRERQFIRDTMNKLESTIIQYENNLGFFANSKGANPFKDEVEEKIRKAREELNTWKEKKKMVDKAMR